MVVADDWIGEHQLSGIALIINPLRVVVTTRHAFGADEWPVGPNRLSERPLCLAGCRIKLGEENHG